MILDRTAMVSSYYRLSQWQIIWTKRNEAINGHGEISICDRKYFMPCSNIDLGWIDPMIK